MVKIWTIYVDKSFLIKKKSKNKNQENTNLILHQKEKL